MKASMDLGQVLRLIQSIPFKKAEPLLKDGLHLQHIGCTVCGVLHGGISKRFDTIVTFTAFEDVISYERKGKNKVKRVESCKIKVTIEVYMVCGVV